MRIDITPILKQKGLKLHQEWEEIFPYSETEFQGPVCLDFTFTNVGKSILASGSLKGTLHLSCANCLSEFSRPFACALSEQFYPTGEIASLESEGISEEELSIYAFADESHIELSEPLRQTVILNLPMHPLCRDGCKGLCPQCGKNRNEGECACRAEFKDERWAPLKGFTPQPQNDKNSRGGIF